jgi:hypothetical protein
MFSQKAVSTPEQRAFAASFEPSHELVRPFENPWQAALAVGKDVETARSCLLPYYIGWSFADAAAKLAV